MRTPEQDERHDLTLAVWGHASPLIVRDQSAIKVGVKCSLGCDLAGTEIELRGDTAGKVGQGALGATPWPGTTALYWTELNFAAPSVDGPHSWTVAVPAVSSGPAHDEASVPFSFIAVGPPEHRVTLKIAKKDAGTAIDAVEVRAGVFRAATDLAGLATLDLPPGTYDLNVWKSGYELASTTVEVAGDVQVDLALVPAPVVEEEYWK